MWMGGQEYLGSKETQTTCLPLVELWTRKIRILLGYPKNQFQQGEINKLEITETRAGYGVKNQEQ